MSVGALALFAFVFQSTHPRGVRLDVRYSDDRVERISIHAPARGATWNHAFFNAEISISIHAPARGATAVVVVTPVVDVISIHAPARGATAVLSKKINDFQISRSFFFCGAVQAAHWARKPTLKPHIRRTLAKRPVQQTADPALSRPKMRDLRPDFGANPSAIL